MAIETGTNFHVKTNLPLDSRSVAKTAAARDAIPEGERYEGMRVYVEDEHKFYTAKYDTGNSNNHQWLWIDAPQLSYAGRFRPSSTLLSTQIMQHGRAGMTIVVSEDGEITNPVTLTPIMSLKRNDILILKKDVTSSPVTAIFVNEDTFLEYFDVIQAGGGTVEDGSITFDKFSPELKMDYTAVKESVGAIKDGSVTYDKLSSDVKFDLAEIQESVGTLTAEMQNQIDIHSYDYVFACDSVYGNEEPMRTIDARAASTDSDSITVNSKRTLATILIVNGSEKPVSIPFRILANSVGVDGLPTGTFYADMDPIVTSEHFTCATVQYYYDKSSGFPHITFTYALTPIAIDRPYTLRLTSSETALGSSQFNSTGLVVIENEAVSGGKVTLTVNFESGGDELRSFLLYSAAQAALTFRFSVPQAASPTYKEVSVKPGVLYAASYNLGFFDGVQFSLKEVSAGSSSGSSDGAVKYTLVKNGSKIKLTGSDGSESSVTDTDTTYTVSRDGDNLLLTDSNGESVMLINAFLPTTGMQGDYLVRDQNGHGVWKTLSVATRELSGLMSPADKKKLDGTDGHTHGNLSVLNTINWYESGSFEGSFEACSGASSMGSWGTAVGTEAQTGPDGTAFGAWSSASVNDDGGGTAIGYHAKTAGNSVAVGSHAEAANGPDSVQLGKGKCGEGQVLNVFDYNVVRTDGSAKYLSDVGQLSGLKTAAKTSIVAAINELAAKIAALS